MARRRRVRRSAQRVRDRGGAPFRGDAAEAPRARLSGVGADLDGLQLEVRVLHRPVGPWPRSVAAARRDPGGGARARGRGRLRDHAARPERELVGARARQRVRRTAARMRRGRRDRPHSFHVAASQGFPPACDRGDGRVRRRVRARAPAVAIRVDACAQGDAADVLARALPPTRRRTTRRRPRPRADDRHHRRLPRRDRGRFPRDARGRRGGRLRRRVHVRLLAAAGHRSGQVPGPGPGRGEARAHRTARRDSRSASLTLGTRSASVAWRKFSSRALLEPIPRCSVDVRGATRR